jgi:hypothetical protein
VLCENRRKALRRVAVVELEHAAEPNVAPYRTCSDRRQLGRDALVAETLVRAFLMIVLDKGSNRGPEVRFTERHDALQALGLDGPDKPLGKCVQI